MPRSTERWRPLLTKVGDLRLRLGQHHSLRKLNHWPQICIKRQRCRQLDKSSLRLATEINNKGHPDRCFNHLHLFIRLCHTITFGSTSHEQKTALLHNSEALSLLDKWIKWLTLQQRCLPDLLWPLRQDSTGLEAALSGLRGGGNTKSSPLCKVTSINYSDTLTESRNLHYFGFKWLVWHFDECREIPLWSGNRGCRSETETLREHKRVFPKMSNSSCVRNNATMWNVRLLSDAPCLTLRLKQQYTLAGAAVKDQTSLI